MKWIFWVLQNHSEYNISGSIGHNWQRWTAYLISSPLCVISGCYSRHRIVPSYFLMYSMVTHHQINFCMVSKWYPHQHLSVQYDNSALLLSKYRQTSNLSRTSVGSNIVDHSDVVGASPIGAASTTSSFSTENLASTDWTRTTARQDENHLSLVIWCALY